MESAAPVVHSDPEILGGTPVFVGTRVPFQTLLDYLEAGDPLGDFLEDFPTVTREQAVAALEQAKQGCSLVSILLDECLPKRLKHNLVGHQARSVPEMGWASKKNGELLALART